ncbi:MAG: 2-isopropylmalate synthase [Methanomassiliicoccales archaeon PtaU1.Bin124]|nr:MAG: 2-isopropylmalate synthase [Methanomassiliicoccales archaeon PtaU1.Bin124]
MRDGAQSEGVSFSTEDKLEVMQRLDDFGIDFIEGGYPGSNPKDEQFFQAAKRRKLKHAKLVAFGSTRKANIKAAEDKGMRSLADAGTEWVAIFGKSWDMQLEKALQCSVEEGVEIVSDSVSFLRSKRKKVIFDAEHYFDGWKSNPKFSMKVLEAAAEAGAEYLVLCDTNGGTYPSDVQKAVRQVAKRFDLPLGIHAHNDSELAVANSLAALEAGAEMVQGTINGLGERCGNANLCSIIPTLVLKMGARTSIPDLTQLTPLSRFVGEIANIEPDPRSPFVGRSAFAHKGGMHVSAVLKDTRTYEHMVPELVGNQRRILISELAGTASLLAKSKELGIDTEKDSGKEILEKLKQMESEGFQFEAAEASLELLIRKLKGLQEQPFQLSGFRLFMDVGGPTTISEASIRVVDHNGNVEHTAADGNGPVNALDRALRKALTKFYPVLSEVRLIDYKVRVIDGKDATAAKVRVLIRSTDGRSSWTTIGVSGNIIEASLMALMDSIEYKLMKSGINGASLKRRKES